MSTLIAEEFEAAEPPSRVPPVVAWSALLAGLAVVVGTLAAVFWAGVVVLPTYEVLADGSATMSEQALSQVVSADIWFTITGLAVGAGLGIVTWRWFNPLGWPTALLAVAAALIAGGMCWRVGLWIGPSNFSDRLATAKSGDLVPISLELRSLAALAVWAFAAVTPILLFSALGRDEEEEAATDLQRDRMSTPLDQGQDAAVDDRGVLTGPEFDAQPRG